MAGSSGLLSRVIENAIIMRHVVGNIGKGDDRLADAPPTPRLVIIFRRETFRGVSRQLLGNIGVVVKIALS
jgi:hypothetical protein